MKVWLDLFAAAAERVKDKLGVVPPEAADKRLIKQLRPVPIAERAERVRFRGPI